MARPTRYRYIEIATAEGKRRQLGMPVTEHFAVTYEARKKAVLTHIPSGYSVAGNVRSVRHGRLIAVALENIGVDWDAEPQVTLLQMPTFAWLWVAELGAPEGMMLSPKFRERQLNAKAN